MANSNNINDFKAQIDGKMRPNRYLVGGNIGNFGAVSGIMVKAAQYPASSLGIIQLPYRGRIAKIPGDRVYPEWTFSIYDSKPLAGPLADTRRAFEQWNEVFNDHTTNVGLPEALAATSGNFQDWTVTLLDTAGANVRTIRLKNCWPVEIGAIDLTYDAADTLTEYTVTLAFDYIETGASPVSAGSGAGGTEGPTQG